MFNKLKEDINTIFERDPAARNVLEIIFCYPGFHALILYRISHWLWNHKLYFFARFLSYIIRLLTGIDIHPAAKIGRRFFIDHGSGVVIGETAEIGNDVTIYHGVTLGGNTWKRVKRHPIIMDNVVIGAGAKIIGPVVIGSNSFIGSGSVVVKEVPPNSTVVGVPGRVVYRKNGDIKERADSALLPDPEAKAISCLFDQIKELEGRIKSLELDLRSKSFRNKGRERVKSK
jgi:serine O-acetyltransferase